MHCQTRLNRYETKCAKLQYSFVAMQYYKRKKHPVVEATSTTQKIEAHPCPERVYNRCMVRPIGYLLLRRRCFGVRYHCSPKHCNRQKSLTSSMHRVMSLSQALLARHKSFRWVIDGQFEIGPLCYYAHGKCVCACVLAWMRAFG